jgi:hypothetical protein
MFEGRAIGGPLHVQDRHQVLPDFPFTLAVFA